MQNVALLQSFSDPVFEDFFKTMESEQLGMSSIQARQDGLLNKPIDHRTYLISVVTPVKTVIQKGLDYNHAITQPATNIAIGQNLRAKALEDVSVKEKEKNAKEKIFLVAKGEEKQLKAGLRNRLSSKLRIIIPAAFGFCEFVLTYNLLESASFPVIAKFFLSAVIGLCTAFGIHLSANYICKAKTRLEQRKRFFIVTSLALAVAIGLGVWRANLYGDAIGINSQIDLNQTAFVEHFSPLPFIIVNFVAFLVGLLFELNFWQTDEEKWLLKLYEEKAQEVKKIEQEFIGLKNEIDDIKLNSTSDTALVIRRQEYGQANEQRLLSLAQQVVNNYESVNLEFRKDGECPTFFGQHINNDFRLYFSQFFNSQNSTK